MILDAALSYAARGWRVVPCDLSTKHPPLKAWGKIATTNAEQIRTWWESEYKDCAIFLVFGHGSNLVDVDLDDKSHADKLADAMGGGIPITPTYQSGSGRGYHYLFRFRADLPANGTVDLRKRGITADLKIGHSGLQSGSVAPPSGNYVWLPGLSPDDVPVADLPDAFVDWLQPPAKHESNSSIILAPSLLEACQAELATLPESVEGHGGSSALFAAACVVHRYALYGPDAKRAIEYYNRERCYPTWSESEIVHKLADAHRATIADGTYASRLPQFAFGAIPIPAAPAKKTRFGVFSVRELFQTTDEPDWLITDAIADQQPCLWVGGSKTLKTTMMLHMSVCLTSPIAFLGHPVPKRRRVLIFSGESGRRPLKKMVRRSCRFLGVDWGSLEGRLLLSTELPQCADMRDMLEFAALIKDWKPDVVMVDPVYLCLSGDDTANLSKQGGLLRRIYDVCKMEEALLMLAHHARKHAGKSTGSLQNSLRRLELSDVTGAGFEEFAGQWVVISRRKPFVAGSLHHELWLGIGGRDDQSAEYAIDVRLKRGDELVEEEWTLNHTSSQVAESREEADKAAELKRRILDAFGQLSGQGTKHDIRDASGLSGTVFQPVWSLLVGEGVIAERGDVLKSNGRRYSTFVVT